MSHLQKPLIAAAVLFAAAPVAAQGVTVAVAPRADSTLYQDANGNLANGGGQFLFAGQTLGAGVRRGLLDFDVAGAVPAGARIVAVELQLNVSRSLFAAPLPVTLHKVLAGWNEGTTAASGQEGAGGIATTGDVTWLHRDRPNDLWAAAGGDYAPLPSGVGITQISGPAMWPSTPGMVADVQGWLDAPAGNFGWLLRTDEMQPSAVRRFDSRENIVAANRPSLQITYITLGQWAPVGSGCGTPTPVMTVTGTPGTGSSFTLVTQAPPGLLAGNFLSLVLLQPPLPLFPGCDLYLLNPVSPGVQFVGASGNIQNTTAVPSTPSFTGLPLAAQGVAIDTNQPFPLLLSNAVIMLLQ